MNNKDKLKNNLDSYIKDQNDKFAFLVNGCWGSGKTYLINEYKEESDKKNSIVYVSLNGATDLEKAFKQAIINNVAIENTKGVIKSGIKSIVKNKLGIELDDISLPTVSIKTVYEKAKKEIIFIDDIERCKCEIDEIFGVIDEFLRNNFKVILIMNNEPFEKDNKENYKEIQEKIINRKITIKPDNNTFNTILEKTIHSEKVHFDIFKNVIQEEYYNWFCILENKEHPTIKYKPNLRLFTRTINNSVNIIDKLEGKQLIRDNNRKLVYTKIINNVYLYLHKETYVNEIDWTELDKNTRNKMSKTLSSFYKPCEKITKERLKYIIPLICVHNWFSEGVIDDNDLYEYQIVNIEELPEELRLGFENVYEEDIENRVNTIIQKIEANLYKPSLIFAIIEILLNSDCYTQNKYLKQYKDKLKNFIGMNVNIIKRQGRYQFDNDIRMDLSDIYDNDIINIIIDLMHTLDKRNAEIALEDFKKNLEDFKKPNYEDYEGILNVEFLNKVIALPHEEIIKNAIRSKKYDDYINIMETLFGKCISGSYYTPEEFKKYIEILKDKILSDDSIDKCARIQFEWLKKRIEEYLYKNNKSD